MSKRIFVIFLLAVVAVVLYGVGFKTGSVITVALAACVELGFWFKLLTDQDKTNSN